MTVIDTDVELNLNGTWTSIVRLDNGEAGVYGGTRAEIEIKRGRTDETRTAFDRATCSLLLNNRDGRFSPRNPTGPYYGQLGRNTPIRVSIPHAEGSALRTLGIDDSNASAPDSAALSITGDIDLRVNAYLDSWHYGTNFISKFVTATTDRSYQFLLTEDGYLRLFWSTAGTFATLLSADSTVSIPNTVGISTGRLSVRVTLDVNNGAAGKTVTFYYSTDTNLATASWTQLGSAVTTAGTTSIYDGIAPVNIGDYYTGFVGTYQYARYFSAEIRSSIGGTVVANPDFNAQTAGAASFADTASSPNTWTMNNGAVIDDRDYRFTGEVSEWPIKWDTTGEDVWVQLEASGVTRRLSQGAAAIGSALYRGTTRIPTLVAYWPLEDGEDSTTISSAIPNGKPMTYGGTPQFAQYTGTFVASQPIPLVNGSSWGGNVPTYTVASPAEIQFQFLMHIDGDSVPANNTCIARLFCTGTATRWDILYNTGGGGLTVEAYNGDTNILSSGPWGFLVDDDDLLVVLQLNQDGSDVEWGLGTYEIGTTSGLSGTGTQTLSGHTISRATGVHMNPPGSAGLADDALGQVSIHSTINAWSDPFLQINGYTGETAGERIVRLCDEESLELRVIGDEDDTALLGVQSNDTLLNNLNDAAATDLGFLIDARDFVGLQYRTRRSMYNQTAKATFDYSAHEMLELEAADDDGALRNDVTATRRGGGSYRAVLESGALSIEAPPDGVGRYDETVTVSLDDDSHTGDHASWRLHMGTVDEPRYSLIVEIKQPALAANSTLVANIRSLVEGDRVDITNPPDWLPPDDIRGLVQGITETLTNMTHRFEISLQPYSPFATGAYGSPSWAPARYSNTGTVTAEALDTTETEVDITNPISTVYWSHADGDFDIMVGGERMTVTAIAGTGVSQTLTVTRSVNGVVKSHATGAEVSLFQPAYFGL